MNIFNKEAILAHIRGAIIKHKSPFCSLEVPCQYGTLSKEDIQKWILPFYQVCLNSIDEKILIELKNVYKQIEINLVIKLLTEYNWRSRLTGALFAALKQFNECENQIGKLLLRSDLCYAGRIYCVALTVFNNENSIKFLNQYLEYYLTRPDLDYDQCDAMVALIYLDKINGTNNHHKFKLLWDKFVKAKFWTPDMEKCLMAYTKGIETLLKYSMLSS